jgi:UDP-galactopyranose mutase
LEYTVVLPGEPRLEIEQEAETIWKIVPVLPWGYTPEVATRRLAELVDQLLERFDIQEYNTWYYSPMAVPFTRHLKPGVVIYDCMDELSAFAGAPPIIRELERELL